MASVGRPIISGSKQVLELLELFGLTLTYLFSGRRERGAVMRQMFEINAFGTMRVLRALLPMMTSGGTVVNLSSTLAARPRPGAALYAATKGAVGNLTKGMATDWARHGLQCNAIAPGYFDTPLNKALVENPEFCRWLEERTPQGRWGRVEELAGACVFLCSDAASFVNGHVLDGGITARL